MIKLVSYIFHLVSYICWSASRSCRPAGGWEVDKGAMHWFIPSLSAEVDFLGGSGRSWWRGKMVVVINGMTGLCVNGSVLRSLVLNLLSASAFSLNLVCFH